MYPSPITKVYVGYWCWLTGCEGGRKGKEVEDMMKKQYNVGRGLVMDMR